MEKLNITRHWTAENTKNFTHRIASDFIAQVETKMETGEISHAELAKRLRLTPGRISQLLNAVTMNLGSAVKLTRALGMKVALVAYDDGDHDNNNGPVNSEIFYVSWKHIGAPQNFFELRDICLPAGLDVVYERTASTSEPKGDLQVTPDRKSVV